MKRDNLVIKMKDTYCAMFFLMRNIRKIDILFIGTELKIVFLYLNIESKAYHKSKTIQSGKVYCFSIKIWKQHFACLEREFCGHEMYFGLKQKF